MDTKFSIILDPDLDFRKNRDRLSAFKPYQGGNWVMSMTSKDYEKKVLPLIYRHYSYTDGLLLEAAARNRGKKNTKLLICLGTSDNPPLPFRPTTCLIWEGEFCIYEGPITNSKEISKMLRTRKICLLNFTTVRNIEQSKRTGERICIKEPGCGKDCNKCPYMNKGRDDVKAIRDLEREIGVVDVEVNLAESRTVC